MSTSIDPNTPITLFYKPHTNEERIVVSFPHGLKGEPVFGPHYKLLEDSLKILGIPIPVLEKNSYPEFKNFEDRQAIYLSDASFGKAFYEVYFKTKMNPENFKWVTT